MRVAPGMIDSAPWWKLSHSASIVIGVIFSSFTSVSSLGRMTWLGGHRSNWHRYSHESGNWIGKSALWQGGYFKEGEAEGSHGKYGELMKIFITTTAGLMWVLLNKGQKYMTKGSTFTWLEQQKMVTIPSFPTPTPSVMRIAIGMTSIFLAFLPELSEWNQLQLGPTLLGWSAWQRVPQTPHRNGEHTSKGVHQQDVHSFTREWLD